MQTSDTGGTNNSGSVTPIHSYVNKQGKDGHGTPRNTKVVVDRSGDILLDKPLPHAVEAEKLVLGVILLDNTMLGDAAAALKPEHFHAASHRLIYRAMLKMADTGQAIVPETLRDVLDRQGDLARCGGPAYLASLFDGVPRFSNLDPYIQLVLHAYTERQLVYVGAEISASGVDRQESVSEKVLKAKRLVEEIHDPSTKIEWHSVGDLAVEHVARAEELAAADVAMTGMATGLHDIDNIMDGMQKGDLIVIGARPSIGKSALVATMAIGAARHPLNKNPVIAFFSLEMSRAQQINRLLAIISGVPLSRIWRGQMTKEDWKAVTLAQEELRSLRIWIDDEGGITPNKLRVKCRELERIEKEPPSLIILDYIQQMNANYPSGSTVADVTQNSKDLKCIAKERNVPLIGVASLSRAAEQRADKRPTMADLRESGQIESDADVVQLLYRDDYYHPQTEKQNEVEVDFAKQRNGATGKIDLIFLRQIGRFESYHRCAV